MASVIQIRRDTAANWTSINPVLHQGEEGWEIDTGKWKRGDGTTAWTSLAYVGSKTPLSNALVQWPDSPSGTFTPYLTFGGATTGITYTLQFGYYQLVGKRCDFSLRITLSSKGTATGIAVVNGLPFTSFSSSSTMSALAIAISSITYTGFPQALVVTSATSISLQYANEAGTTTNMTDTNFSNGSILVINGSYFIA